MKIDFKKMIIKTFLIIISITFFNSKIYSQIKKQIWTEYVNFSGDIYYGDKLKINGNLINKNEYGFYPKRYPVVFTKYNNKQILIWKDTKEKITELEYDEIVEISYNTFIVKVNKLYGIIDSTGKSIIPIKYSSINNVDPIISLYDDEGMSILENNFSNLLDNQLFECTYSYEKSINGVYSYTEILNRNGKVLVRENNSNIELNYYKINNELYTLYKIKIGNLKGDISKFRIGKWGDSSTIKFDGEIVELHEYYRDDFISLTKRPLYKLLKKENKLRFFNLESLKEITSVPLFDELTMDILKKNEMFITRTLFKNKIGGYNDIYESIISKDFKVVLPFVPYYQFLESKYDSSLIIFNSNNGVGIFKLGKDIVEPLKFKSIGFIENYNKFDNSKLMIVTNKDNSENIIDLSTLNLVFTKKYDKIVFNGREFECTFEGKTETIFLEIY